MHQIFSLTQHAGLAENVRNHRLNTHTVEMNVAFRFLYFSMTYHIQHHMFPMAPFMLCTRLHPRPRPRSSRVVWSCSTHEEEIKRNRSAIQQFVRFPLSKSNN